jgi:hypothetical protein
MAGYVPHSRNPMYRANGKSSFPPGAQWENVTKGPREVRASAGNNIGLGNVAVTSVALVALASGKEATEQPSAIGA